MQRKNPRIELTSFSDSKFYGFGYDSVTEDYKIIVSTESSASGFLGTKSCRLYTKNGFIYGAMEET